MIVVSLACCYFEAVTKPKHRSTPHPLPTRCEEMLWSDRDLMCCRARHRVYTYNEAVSVLQNGFPFSAIGAYVTGIEAPLLKPAMNLQTLKNGSHRVTPQAAVATPPTASAVPSTGLRPNMSAQRPPIEGPTKRPTKLENAITSCAAK